MSKQKNGYTFLEFAKDVLEASAGPLSPIDIWKEGEKLGLTERLGSSGKTPWQTIGAQIYMNIKAGGSDFCQVSKRPVMFSLVNKEISQKPPALPVYTPPTVVKEKKTFEERDLHIMLSSFVKLNSNFKCCTKTIYHEKSKKEKKGFNKWLHPDIVGCYFPFDDFSGNTQVLQDLFSDNALKLYSFEMKISVTYSNLRECYFQAVSNSSWANEGYLVTLNLEEEDAFMDELLRLNKAFGIGIIKLVPEHISQSEVVFPARYNSKVDWDTVDRLLEENTDFVDFTKDIAEDVKLRKVKSDYDQVILDDDEMAEYAKKKNII